MNGFEPKSLTDEQAARLVGHIIQDSEQTFGYTAKVKEHPVEPLLNKWFYIHQLESVDSKTTYQKQELAEEVADARALKAALTSSTSASSGGDTKVKEENPALGQALALVFQCLACVCADGTDRFCAL